MRAVVKDVSRSLPWCRRWLSGPALEGQDIAALRLGRFDLRVGVHSAACGGALFSLTATSG
jgi:hypothetical protein